MRRASVVIVLIMAVAVLFGCSQKIVKPTPTPVLDGIVQRGELVVGTAASMPPLNMTTTKGEIIGFEIDLAKMMASAMGVKLRVEAMEFSKLLPALENGKVDMVLSGMTITPARNLKVAFVGPYFISGKAFLTKIETIAKAEEATEVNSPNIRLTALRGSTSQYFVEQVLPKVQFVPAKDYNLLSVVTPLTYEPLGIAVPSYDPHLVNWLENFLDSLEETGGMDELTARWFEDASWLNQLP
jgi:polar amino acid transport system substrate-binding protein